MSEIRYDPQYLEGNLTGSRLEDIYSLDPRIVEWDIDPWGTKRPMPWYAKYQQLPVRGTGSYGYFDRQIPGWDIGYDRGFYEESEYGGFPVLPIEA